MRPAPPAALALALAAVAAAPVAGRAQTVRSEIPIRSVVLSDGAQRFSIPVTVGAATVEAGLDTGSAGLRILPGVLGPADARPTGRRDHMGYGGGAEFEGEAARAHVAVGAVAGDMEVELITAVGCTAAKPGCPAGKADLQRFGVQGDGLPGEGFKAIAGVIMGDVAIPSLLNGVGARSWIVELPRPGEAAPGRLVVNPSAEETAGYVRLKVSGGRSGLHDSVPGCLRAQGGANVCGQVTFDSGAPGVQVLGAGRFEAAGQAARLEIGPAGAPVAATGLVFGRRAQSSHLAVEPPPRALEGRGAVIRAGILPYYAWSVLYDPGAGEIGVKARPTYPGGPTPDAARAP